MRLLTTTGAGATTAAETTGTTNGTMTLTYSIANVPAGTYFMLAAVDVDKKKGITWAEAIRAYNGSGAHAEHYRAAVLKRAAEAAARKPGSPLIPSGI